MYRLKRVYEDPSPDDGYRVLVERLWPRGIKKEQAQLDLWLKEAAPTPELRVWFNHDDTKWEEFRSRYMEELKQNTKVHSELEKLARKDIITLVFAARNTDHNAAVVLKQYLEENF